MCLYVITAGALPFDEPNLGALFHKISKAEYHTPTWFSEELAHLLHAILVPDPKARSVLAYRDLLGLSSCNDLSQEQEMPAAHAKHLQDGTCAMHIEQHI